MVLARSVRLVPDRRAFAQDRAWARTRIRTGSAARWTSPAVIRVSTPAPAHRDGMIEGGQFGGKVVSINAHCQSNGSRVQCHPQPIAVQGNRLHKRPNQIGLAGNTLAEDGDRFPDSRGITGVGVVQDDMALRQFPSTRRSAARTSGCPRWRERRRRRSDDLPTSHTKPSCTTSTIWVVPFHCRSRRPPDCITGATSRSLPAAMRSSRAAIGAARSPNSFACNA